MQRKTTIFLAIITLFISMKLNAKTDYKINFIPSKESHFLNVIKSSSDTTDLITKKLLKFKYKKYVNKPISELLKDLKLSYKKIHFLRMKPMYLSFVIVEYSDYINLDIYTEDYVYLKRELVEGESYDMWKVEDLLKEKVTKIRVRNRYGKTLKEYPKKPMLPVI